MTVISVSEVGWNTADDEKFLEEKKCLKKIEKSPVDRERLICFSNNGKKDECPVFAKEVWVWGRTRTVSLEDIFNRHDISASEVGCNTDN